MTNIERIMEMEQRMDRVDEALHALESALDTIIGLEDDILKLDDYYSSDEWKSDFQADESGLLPKDLKRGVLSEDGIWNLLVDQRVLMQRLFEMIKNEQK